MGQVTTTSPTKAPTKSPTKFPTKMPTATPSVSPTKIPSQSPSFTPSQFPRESVRTTAELSLRPVSGLLEGETEGVFLNETIEFLYDKLVDIESIQVKIERQSRLQRRRYLQEGVLYLDLRVSGDRILYTNSSYSFDDVILNVFEDSRQEFIAVLKDSGDPFFGSLEYAGLPETQAPSTSPTAAPTDSPTVNTGFDYWGLEQEVFVGIVAGVAAFLIILIVLFYIYWRQKGRKDELRYSSDIPEGMSSLDSLPNTPINASSPQSGDSSTYYGGSIMQSSQGDANSYSYSVDPGVETIVGGASIQSKGGIPVPVEIPQLKIPNQNSADSELNLVPSDLRLTDSELAMLPPNLRSSSSDGKPVTRIVIAPPGKLGIIIDTTIEGPVVHKINNGSPMTGTLLPGEIIIAIDEVDCRALSAAAITQLMIKTTGRDRKLTIARSSK